MRHLPLDPLSCIALVMAGLSLAHSWLRRWRQRAHCWRFLRTAADVGCNRRGAR